MSDKKNKSAAKPQKAGKVRRIVSTVIFIMVLACAILLFIPDGLCPEVNTGLSEFANDKLSYTYFDRNSEMFRYLFKKYGKMSRLDFSCEEMHYLFNNRFLNNEAINMDTVWEVYGINFIPAGENVKVVLYTRLAGVIPVTFTVTGNVEKRKSAYNLIGFNVKTARMGLMPFPGKTSKFVTDKFKPMLECLPEISNAFSKSSEVKFKDGKFVFKLAK